MSIELGATHMRYFFATILLLVGFQAFGQSNNRCVPNNPADTLTINRCFDSAQYYFNGQDYLKAASFFHEAEYIIPNCSDILENLAICYWEYTQDGSKLDAKRLLIAKKYLELCVQDKWIPRNRKNNYQNCLDEINNVLGRILVQKNYSNGTYYGEMQNNNREGFGIFYFTNGQRYEGRWIDDKKEDFEGELYNSRNVLIYKGFFHNNEKLDYEKPDLADDIDYWESIKNSNDTAAYRRYLDKFGETGLYKDDARKKIAILQPSDTQRNDAVKDSILAEIDDYIRDINIEMKREGLERNIIDFSYSLSGYYSLRTGSMHHNRWGYYSGCGIKGDVINDGIYGINSMRYTIGALYAPTYWMYVYAGGGLTIDSLNANDNFTSTAELGLLFKLGALSLSTGIQADDFYKDGKLTERNILYYNKA